jgi:hypothetical protein
MVIDEVDASEFAQVVEKLKSLVSEDIVSVERKCVDRVNIANYLRFIMFSNRDNPVVIPKDDRRHSLHDASNRRADDQAFWTELREMYADRDVQRAIFEYLMSVDITTNFCDPKTIRQTDARKEVQGMNLEWVPQFLGLWMWHERVFIGQCDGVWETGATELNKLMNSGEECRRICAAPLRSALTPHKMGKTILTVPGVTKRVSNGVKYRIEARKVWDYLATFGIDYMAGFVFPHEMAV